MGSFSQCRGITKQNKLCRRDWDLDRHGFCQLHRWQAESNLKERCLGTTKSTGARCRIQWDLDKHGFCKYHGGQYTDNHASATPPAAATTVATVSAAASAASPVLQCGGTTKNGARCQITLDLNEDFMCAVHRSNVVSNGASPAMLGRLPLPVANTDYDNDGDDDDDDDDASAHTSDASSRDATDDEDQDESKPSVDTRDHRMLPTLGLILHFEKAKWMGANDKVRSTIHDTSGKVVEQGASLPGVACLLSNVRADGTTGELHLVVAVDNKKHGSITSEPHRMDALRTSGKVKIATMRSVVVHVVPLESVAAP